MTTREECLKKAMEIVCTDRESQYGAPEDNFAKLQIYGVPIQDIL